MAFTPFSARYSPIRLGESSASDAFIAKKWVVAFVITEDETTNFEGGGFYESKTGIKKVSITVDEADYDSSVNPFASPLLVVPGQLLKCKLYLTKTTNANARYWDFTTANCGITILTATNTADVQKNNKLSFTAVSYGTFLPPAGIFTPD